MDPQAVEKFLVESTALKTAMSGLGQRLNVLCAEAKCLLEGADRLRAERAKLDADRGTFEAERTSVAQLEAQGRDRVVLDVGGTHFATTRQTLAAVPGSMLAAWFSGRHAIKARPDGTVFIDRSPALFGYVLDFLRAVGQGQRWPQDADEEEALRAEFDYFVLPWPKNPPPASVIDAFGGELECVEMEGVVDNLIWVEASGSRAFGGSKLQENDTNRTGVLWDLNTGAWIRTWRSIEPGNGFVYALDLKGDYVYVVYSNPDSNRCTHVAIYSSVDGSPLRSFPLEEPYPMANEIGFEATVLGNRLFIVRPENVSVWDVTSGARLWVVDNTQMELVKVHWNYNEHVCVGMSHRKCVVFGISTGEIVYQVDGFADKLDERDCFPVGQALSLLTLYADEGSYFGTYDAHGVVAVPATHIPTLLGTMNGEAEYMTMVGLHSANIISMRTTSSFRMYRLTFPTEFTVDVAESRVVSLGDGDWWSQIVWCMWRVGPVIAGGKNGKVKVWKAKERKSQKRPRN